MASEPLHGPSSQSAYPSSRDEEPYPPNRFTQPSYFSHTQTSNEASAVSYNEVPYQPRVYPAPQGTQANSDRNPPGSAAQARPAINTPSTFSPLPAYGTNSHSSPSPTQRSPTPHSHPPPRYESPNPFDESQRLEGASHHPLPGLSGGHLSVASHIHRPPPVIPGPTIGPQPPLDVESLSRNSGRRRDSVVRSSEHSPTSSTSHSTSFRNSAVPCTGSTSFLNDVPKESAVARNSFPRGRTHPMVQPLRLPWPRKKAKILSTLGEGRPMNIDVFCNTYSLPDTILQLFRVEEISGTHAFSHLTENDLTKMGFKIGQIIDLKEAIKTWASSRESF